MPALFQYAILFLAALLCVSLVLCVRESTDPKEQKPALPPGTAKRAPERVANQPSAQTEPSLARASSLRRDPPASRPAEPLPLNAAGLREERPLFPAASRLRDPEPAGQGRPSPQPKPALQRQDRPPLVAVEDLEERIAYLRPEAPRFNEPAPRAVERAVEAETRLPHGPAGERAIRAERDGALDQRNDTLWDLVVHLRDYVEQLRAERHTLREEAQQLRDALAEATEEVRALRSAQAAANSNEFATAATEPRVADVHRLTPLPKRIL
jgi:hypothetical protein